VTHAIEKPKKTKQVYTAAEYRAAVFWKQPTPNPHAIPTSRVEEGKQSKK